ncbi:MAG: lipoyl(octanoyl) transferase LipB [Acidobacteria bacterium]|nr:MAG: lipoyl(octanoyl) transferase LipB [Acidobacteriota bacterium]
MTTSAGRTLAWRHLGRMAYAPAVALQERLARALKDGSGEEHLLTLEHEPVYTVGRNAREEDVVAGRAWLQARGIEVHRCDRGGKVTYHGPGQLVGYPILDLRPDRCDVKRYVHDLQEVLIRTLDDFGVAGWRREGKEHVGVWVGPPESPRKIASIGVHLSRWVTTHGFALNVTTELEVFSGIVACGLPGVEMTSIAREKSLEPALETVAERAAHHAAAVFERRLHRVP